MAAIALPVCSPAQQQPDAAHLSRLLLILPFENTSNAASLDWIGESFPEVLSYRLGPSGLFIMSREDRLKAFDRLGIPATAKPSRATLYQVAQQLDVDYVLIGDYRVEGPNITIHAQLMDMERLRLSPEMADACAICLFRHHNGGQSPVGGGRMGPPCAFILFRRSLLDHGRGDTWHDN